MISQGKAFGVDLPERLKANAPLNAVEEATLYSSGPEGYLSQVIAPQRFHLHLVRMAGTICYGQTIIDISYTHLVSRYYRVGV